MFFDQKSLVSFCVILETAFSNYFEGISVSRNHETKFHFLKQEFISRNKDFDFEAKFCFLKQHLSFPKRSFRNEITFQKLNFVRMKQRFKTILAFLNRISSLHLNIYMIF